ncbi:hypothetical protein H0N99_02480 [Candidatus Micrarchaeota archaeon]|nr:hypothetical protein [Candidatus Micrarchaeota archaeon]
MERNIALACIGIGTILVAMTFIISGLWSIASFLLILAPLFSVAGLLLFKYGYWMLPFLTRRVRVIDVIEEPYEFSTSQDAVIKKIGNAYYASMFIHVKVYESTTEKSEDQKAAFMDLWERAISGLKFVTKFCISSYAKDLTKYRSIIENKKADAQLRLANERGKPEPNEATLSKLEREISMWDNMLSKIATGNNAIMQITYIMTCGQGPTPEMALAAAKNQANEIKSTISTTLNADVAVLTGDDMKRCFEWEYMLPPQIREESSSQAGV